MENKTHTHSTSTSVDRSSVEEMAKLNSFSLLSYSNKLWPYSAYPIFGLFGFFFQPKQCFQPVSAKILQAERGHSFPLQLSKENEFSFAISSAQLRPTLVIVLCVCALFSLPSSTSSHSVWSATQGSGRLTRSENSDANK